MAKLLDKLIMADIEATGALQLLGIPLEGTHHRGVDDSTNIARILRRILSN